MLARALRDQHTASYKPHIKGKDRQNLFLFVQSLSITPSSLEEYLFLAHLSRLPSPASRNLEAPKTMEELHTAVKADKPGKASGPDRINIQYYKALLPLLGPHMIKVFNALGQTTLFPHPVYTVDTCLSHSEGGERHSFAAVTDQSLCSMCI